MSDKHPLKRQGAAATLACMQFKIVDDKKVALKKIKASIVSVGNSRIYRFSQKTSKWLCLTRDHNLLNELIDQQAKIYGVNVQLSDYNREGMASSLYAITEYFVLTPDEDNPKSQVPNSFTDSLNVSTGDIFLICSDGIHDLVSTNDWQSIEHSTDLQKWLLNLKTKIYKSEGRAYDNGTAIVINFS